MMFSLLGFLVFNRRGKRSLERFDDFSLAHCQTRQTPPGGGVKPVLYVFEVFFFFSKFVYKMDLPKIFSIPPVTLLYLFGKDF